MICSPDLTVKLFGLNCRFSMTTMRFVETAPGIDAAVPVNRPATVTPHLNDALRSGTAFAQPALQTLCVFKMRREGGSHFDEQCLELCILRIGNQYAVNRIQYCLMVRDLMIDVRAVECGSAEPLQRGQIVVAAFLQALAGGVAFGSHVQFL